MALKSYTSFKKSKKKKSRPIRDIVAGGVGALVGIALVSQTANVLRRL